MFGHTTLRDAYLYSSIFFVITILSGALVALLNRENQEVGLLLIQRTEYILLAGWLVIILLCAALMAVIQGSYRGRLQTFKQVFWTGLVSKVLVLLAFLVFLRYLVTFDDIFFFILRLLAWREVVGAFAVLFALFFIGMPLLYALVYESLKRFFWHRVSLHSS